MSKIFVVEDDENIRDLVLYALTQAGFDALGFENGKAFQTAADQSRPDLVLLDIMLPDGDGLSVLRDIRSRGNLPVILLTAKGSEYDRVKGLDAGADDYITKPFSVLELIARVKAVLRRGGTAPAAPEGMLSRGALRLDSMRRTVAADGKNIPLTYKEFELLHFMLLNYGIVLSREKLMNHIWGFDFEGESRTVDMHIKTLRQKLGAAGRLIRTVRGVGYKLEE